MEDSLRLWTPSLGELGVRWAAGALFHRVLHRDASTLLRVPLNDSGRDAGAPGQPFLKLRPEKECVRGARTKHYTALVYPID